MENELRIDRIQRTTLNGKKVKLVDIQEFIDSTWLFIGRFDIPVRIANKNIISYLKEQDRL